MKVLVYNSVSRQPILHCFTIRQLYKTLKKAVTWARNIHLVQIKRNLILGSSTITLFTKLHFFENFVKREHLLRKVRKLKQCTFFTKLHFF